MYSLDLILVSGGDVGLTAFRTMLTELATRLEVEFDSAERLLHHWPVPPTQKRVIILRMRSPDDLRQLERVSTAFPGWPLVALIEGECDVGSLYQISRAGACQILPLASQAEDFAAALSRIQIQFALQNAPSRLITVSGTVEGCGATSLAINLADDIVVRHKVPCILVEFAIHAGRLASYLNLSPQTTTLDLLKGDAPIKLIEVRGALTQLPSKLFVLVGPFRSIETQIIAPERFMQLLRILRQLAPIVVVDMPYTLDDHYFQALGAADTVVLVTQQNVPAIQAMRTMSDTLRLRDASLSQTLVVNRFREDNEEFSLARLQGLLAVPMLWPIPYDPFPFAEALNSGLVLRERSPRSPALQGIANISDSILGPLPRLETPFAAGLFNWFRRGKHLNGPTSGVGLENALGK